MQAAHMDDGTLRIGEVPAPEPGPDQALVRISASGVCHSDLHLAVVTGWGSPAPARSATRESGSWSPSVRAPSATCRWATV